MTLLEAFDLIGIHIDADNVVAYLGQNCSLHQADVADAKYGDFHGVSLALESIECCKHQTPWTSGA
ncbi:hypothetical protein D9M69_589730 [compost metagenome]